MRLLNYTKAGRPFWNMLTVASVHDSSNTAKLLVGVQVDVTEHPTEAQAAPVGTAAAGVVGCALQRLGWEGEADPWAGFPSEVEPVKPHKAQDPAWAALQAAAQVCVGWAAGRRGCARRCLLVFLWLLLPAALVPAQKSHINKLNHELTTAAACSLPCPALPCPAVPCRPRAASWRRPTSLTSRSWGLEMLERWTLLSWQAPGTSLP